MTPSRCSRSLKSAIRLHPGLWTVVCVLLLAAAPIALHAQTYTDLHDFNCNPDGCNANYPAIPAQGRDGDLYGTLTGGASNHGTIYKITPSGTFSVLYTFSGTDGSIPYSGLTLGTDGNFYGTTVLGGANNCGTIFNITPAGALTTLHSFACPNGGGSPVAGPVQGKTGSFYGVTSSGTGYSITPSGTFKQLTAALPGTSFAPLVAASDGNFYGTTETGGTHSGGTVFRMSATGAVKIVFSFDAAHGYTLLGPVAQGSDGFLYGTTLNGGSIANAAGTVFKLSTKGKITLLHQFDNSSITDGYNPYAGLVAAMDGSLYGSTSTGRSGGSAPGGTLFKITKSDVYSILYASDGTHGWQYLATAMQHTNGTLYGLANQGGPTGGGVFYSLGDGIAPFVSLVGYPSGTADTTVEILGDGLTGATSVLFGSASASFNVVSDTYMTAVVPAAGTTGIVTVKTPSGSLQSKQTFQLVPTITSFTPPSGPVGTPVTITGTGLTGATKVTFGGVNATVFTVISGTQVKATVPTGAKTGKIGITTAGGSATSKSTFTVK